MPARGEGRAVAFMAIDLCVVVYVRIDKRRAVYLNNFVPGFAVGSEKNFECAEQAYIRSPQTGEIVASKPIRMVSVRKPPRKIAILFMLLSSMLSLRCTGRFGMKNCRECRTVGLF